MPNNNHIEKPKDKQPRKGLWFFGERCYRAKDCVTHAISYIVRKIKAIRYYLAIRRSVEPKEYIYAFKVPVVENKKPRVSESELEGFRQLILPIYFGWEIVIRHRPGWEGRVAKPFRTYWQYFTTVVVLIFLVSVTIFINQTLISKAATYNFIQTDWSGGATANTAAHSSDQNGWTEYTSKDSNISAGTEVVLTEGLATLTETSDTDFNAGATSTAAVTGSGDSAYVALETSSGSDSNVTGYSSARYRIEVSGDYAYFCNGNSGLIILDISDPENISEEGTFDNGQCYDLKVYGNYVYVDDLTSIDIINVTNKTSPSLAGSFPLPSSASIGSMAISGSTMFVSGTVSGCGGYCSNANLHAYSLADPTSPSFLDSSNQISGGLGEIIVDDNYAYLLAGDVGSTGLMWWDISNPSSLGAFAGDIDLLGVTSHEIETDGAYLYVSSDTTGVRVLSTTTDAIVHTYDTAGTARGMDISGSTLYVADSNSLLSLDVSNPLSISENTSYTSALAYRVDYSNAYAYALQYHSGVIAHSIPSYASSGTFTSQILDTTANSSFGNLSWTESVPSGTDITVKVRTSNDSGMSGATNWASCTAVTSGSDISSNGCVTDGHRYVQYQATLTTSDVGNTPQLQDVSIQYNSYTNGSLLSSAFDSEDSTNVMGSMQWTESGTGDVQFQIRTAPDSGGSPDWANGSAWCGPSNCAATTGDTDYAASYHTTSDSAVHSSQTTGNDDQWFQYRLWLTSADGSSTPTVSDATVVYVVNAPPEFETTATASQGSDGLITIDYSIRDTDTTAGSVTPGYVTPSFQYSTDNGNNWNNITTGLSANATSTKAVDEASYTAYQATWTARDQVDVYATQTKIRVVIDDSEGANNTASSDTTAFAMDAKAPTLGSPAIYVVATTTPASVFLSASDDTSLEMCVTLDNTQSNCVSYATTATLNISSEPDTAYVIFKDAYNNTSSASAVTPETPTNLIVRDLSNIDTSEYRLFISWAAVSTPVDEFSNYRIWRSTDGSNYSLLTSINDRTVNYYLDTGLSTGTTYYYKVATEDNDGNVSYFQTPVSDSPDGQGGTDTTPPTISSVSAGSISTQSAVITWTTDELADSTVGYSTSAGNFDTEVGVATMTTTPHSVTLTGLSPNTTYYYQVTSDDPSNSTTTDNSGGDGHSFTTLAGPAISAVSASSVQNTSATITWNTDIAADSTVYYSTNSDMSDPGSESPPGGGSVTEHSVTISDLTGGAKYYFYVTSGVATDNNGGEYYYFNTTSDSTAPVITDVEANLIGDDDALINWTTDELANSKVAYGTASGSYATSTAVTTDYSTSHGVALSDLTSNTLYYYIVVSSDQSSNIATSTENTFTTLEQLSEESEVTAREQAAESAGFESVSCGGGGGSNIDTLAPDINDVTVEVEESQATINWNTSERAMSMVYYGLENVTDNSVSQFDTLESLVKEHSIGIKDLVPDAIYKYQVVSIDTSGNVAFGDEGNFSTASFLPTVSDGSEGGVAATEESFLNTVEQATAFFENMSTEVSLGAFKSGVVEHVADLASFVPPPIISGEPILTVSSHSAVVSWETEDDANALVSYATEDYYFDNNDYEFTVGEPESYLSGVHKIVLTGLEPETIYHYQIKSQNEVGSTAESKDFTLTTIPELAAVESYTTEITSPEEVTFKWITTVPTDSQVVYTPYHNGELSVVDARQASNDVLTTIHNVSVDGFEAGVFYQIELSGGTVRGDTVNQIIPSFATSDDNLAPIIRQVKTDAALSFGKETKVQAIISWFTNEPSTSRVYYEQGAGRSDEELTQSSPRDENFARHHVVVITNFNPGSIYRFQVESTDTEGNSSRSRTYTILTPKQQESVFQVIMRNVEETFGWLDTFK